MLPNGKTTSGKGSRKNWLAILDELDVQFLVLDTRHDRDLCQLIRSQSGWTIDFQTGTKVLFARTQALGNSRVAA